jgi:hypothetical protein
VVAASDVQEAYIGPADLFGSFAAAALQFGRGFGRTSLAEAARRELEP